jgi:hypothetical protein
LLIGRESDRMIPWPKMHTMCSHWGCCCVLSGLSWV